MAHHKSAIKRIKTNERNHARNKMYKTRIKNQIKKVRAAENKEEGQRLFRQTESLLDKLVVKGIIHRNTAANKKSKLAKHVQNLE